MWHPCEAIPHLSGIFGWIWVEDQFHHGFTELTNDGTQDCHSLCCIWQWGLCGSAANKYTQQVTLPDAGWDMSENGVHMMLSLIEVCQTTVPWGLSFWMQRMLNFMTCGYRWSCKASSYCILMCGDSGNFSRKCFDFVHLSIMQPACRRFSWSKSSRCFVRKRIGSHNGDCYICYIEVPQIR